MPLFITVFVPQPALVSLVTGSSLLFFVLWVLWRLGRAVQSSECPAAPAAVLQNPQPHLLS